MQPLALRLQPHVLCTLPSVLRLQPPWRLVLLKGRGASEASYPAWPVTEKARPKVLVFLSLWWMLLGVKGEPSELSMAFEAYKGMSDKGEYEGYGCRRLPLDGGRAGSHDGIRRFPAGVEAGGFTSP